MNRGRFFPASTIGLDRAPARAYSSPAMSRLAVTPLLVVLALGVAVVCAGQTPANSRPGVLLLHNGELISGSIVRAGEYYVVSVDRGELRIKATEVDHHAATADDCYQKRREAIDPTKVDEHLNLAEWCMRHALYAQAAKELTDALKTDPTHPKIGLLERRLELVARQQPEPGETAKSTARSDATVAELDRLVRGLPGGAMETYTNVVQPLLLHHCGTAACHSPQAKSSLHLVRLPPGRSANRRTTQRNLLAVLGAIDRDSPDNSPLLTIPIRPHGTAKGAIFGSRQASQYRTLAAWVHQVSGSTAEPMVPSSLAAAPASAVQRASAQLELEPGELGVGEGEPGETRSEPRRFLRRPSAPQRKSRTSPPLRPAPAAAPPRAAPKVGDPARGFVPKDPQDLQGPNPASPGGVVLPRFDEAK